MKTKRTSNNNDNFQFAQIVQGEFHVKVNSDTQGAIMRKNKNDVEVHELIYNEIEGVFLHEFEVTESDFGKQLKIYLRDEENKDKFFVIQVPLNSGYAFSILNRAKQVDLLKPVTVKVFDIENEAKDGGKPFKTKSITLSQNSEKVNKSWDKDNNPVPKPSPILDKKGNPIVKNGYEQYDYSEKEAYLENYVNETLVPAMKEVIKDVYMEKPVLENVDIETQENNDPFN